MVFSISSRQSLEELKPVLELINELTIAFLLYHIVCFSDIYNKDVAKGAENYMGYTFNGCIAANLIVHLSLLVGTYIQALRIAIKRRKCCCQRRKN